MTEKEEEATKLPSEVEAAIALNWGDNAAAAQLSRTVARAMLAGGIDMNHVREKIQNSGRVVD